MDSGTVQFPSVAEQIMEACKQKNWNLKRLASESKISLKYVNRYVRGTTPRDGNLTRLQDTLGIQIQVPIEQNVSVKKNSPVSPKKVSKPSEPQKIVWEFTNETSELSAKVEEGSFEIKVKYREREIFISARYGLHIGVKIGNGDVFEIEPEEMALAASCRSKDMVASSGGGRNRLLLKQID